MSRVDGTFVVSITPFNDDGQLDEDGLRRHLRRMADAGIGVYLGGSGSGEGYSLDASEMRRVLEIGADELRGRVPVRAMGVEPRTAHEMVELGRVAADVGVDAMQVYSLDLGHGNAPTPGEVERYLCDVLDAVRVPVILSTHQSVGYFVPIELVDRLLARYESIVGINCSHNDLTYLSSLIDTVDGRADVHVGGPMHALSCLAAGGQGFLSSDANIAPKLCASLITAHDAGDAATVDAAYARLMRLHTALRGLGGIAATKAALALLGLPGGVVRPPRLPFAAERSSEIAALLDDLDLRSLEGIA